MSQENVDLVRRMIDAGNRGDLTAWASGLHDEIVYFPLAENPQTKPLHGVAAVLDFVTDWLEPWDEYTVEVTRTVDAGDWVFVATKHSARHETGAEISMEMYIAGAVRDGKFTELRWFMNEPDALEAAGLREWAGSQENVELYFEAKDRLAVADHEGFSRLLHPDVTATVEGMPEPGPFVGRDALVAQLEGLGTEFDDHRYTDIEVVAKRDDWVVLTYRWWVRGSGSGVETHADIAVAYRVEDAQLIEVHWRPTRDEALEAAGLRE